MSWELTLTHRLLAVSLKKIEQVILEQVILGQVILKLVIMGQVILELVILGQVILELVILGQVAGVLVQARGLLFENVTTASIRFFAYLLSFPKCV